MEIRYFGITSLIFPPVHSPQSLNPWMIKWYLSLGTPWKKDFSDFRVSLFATQPPNFTILHRSESKPCQNPLTREGYKCKCYFLVTTPGKTTRLWLKYHMLVLTIPPLSDQLCVTKQSLKGVESHDDIIESSNIPKPMVSTTIDLKPRKTNPKKPSLKGWPHPDVPRIL